jgi:hypothetical protein
MLHLFFWKDYRDPYAIYDYYGDRYWTGGDESYENQLVIDKILLYR